VEVKHLGNFIVPPFVAWLSALVWLHQLASHCSSKSSEWTASRLLYQRLIDASMHAGAALAAGVNHRCIGLAQKLLQVSCTVARIFHAPAQLFGVACVHLVLDHIRQISKLELGVVN
jgi:hypothetical protein